MSLTSEFTDAHPEKGGEPAADIGALMPRKKVAAELGVCPRSVARYEKNDPAFPKPIRINHRIYIRVDEFTAYKAVLVRRGLCAA